MTVQKVLDYLNTLAPAAMKYEWDNVGLICGRRDQEVKKSLLRWTPLKMSAGKPLKWVLI